MSVIVFNACLLLGWLLVLAGGVLLSPGAGLLGAGLLLIVLCFMGVRVAGGLIVPARKPEGEGD